MHEYDDDGKPVQDRVAELEKVRRERGRFVLTFSSLQRLGLASPRSQLGTSLGVAS